MRLFVLESFIAAIVGPVRFDFSRFRFLKNKRKNAEPIDVENEHRFFLIRLVLILPGTE